MSSMDCLINHAGFLGEDLLCEPLKIQRKLMIKTNKVDNLLSKSKSIL